MIDNHENQMHRVIDISVAVHLTADLEVAAAFPALCMVWE